MLGIVAFANENNVGPLLNMTDERPRSLTVKSFGISLGMKF